MAGRKVEFMGVEYGNWTVTARKPGALGKGKRCWEVTNNITGAVKVVLQTDLEKLQDEDEATELLDAATPDWADGLDEGDIREYELPEFLGYEGDLNSDGLIPGNNKGDLEVSDGWVEKAVELHSGPKLDGPNPHRHPSASIGETGELRVVTKFDGIGEAAEDGVSETELDGRVPEPSEVRTLIRKLMVDAHDLQVIAQDMASRANDLTEVIDWLLKADISR